MPNLIAITLLAVLILSGSVSFLRSTGNFYKKRKRFAVFELPEGKVKNLKDVFGALKVPFTLEVAVSQLGKTKRFYITLPTSKSKKVIDTFGAKEVDDYDLYHPGGVVVGAYATGKGSLNNFDARTIDFSEVNEIGEGAVVQFVMRKKSKDHFVANVRTLVSAPSLHQSKEIFTGIKKSLAGIKLVEVKSGEFMNRVNERVFSEKESVALSI